jgi:hypothetical protein
MLRVTSMLLCVLFNTESFLVSLLKMCPSPEGKQVIWPGVRLFQLRLEAWICIILNLLHIKGFYLLGLIYWGYHYLMGLLQIYVIGIINAIISLLLLDRLLLISIIWRQMELPSQQVVIILYLKIQMTLMTCAIIDTFRQLHYVHWHLVVIIMVVDFAVIAENYVITSRVLHLD